MEFLKNMGFFIDEFVLNSSMSQSEFDEIFRLIITNSNDAIYLMHKRKYIYVNQKFIELTGYSFEELTSQSFDFGILLPPESKNIVELRYDNLKVGNSIEPIYSTEIAKKEGGNVKVEVSSKSIGKHGEVVVVGIIRELSSPRTLQSTSEPSFDLTKILSEKDDKIKQLQSKIDELLKQKQAIVGEKPKKHSKNFDFDRELGEMKKKYIKLFTDEYKEPLELISSSTQIIESFVANQNYDKLDTYIAKINRCVRTINSMLEDVLTVETATTGKVKPVFSYFDIIKLINEIVESVRVVDKDEHELDFFKEISDLIIYTDVKIFRQIILNLILNACKHSPKGTAVSLDIKAMPLETIIRVIDSGDGINKELISSIVHPSEKEKKEASSLGVGLKLSTIRKLIKSIRGEFLIRSKPNVGTTFVVKIPHLDKMY